MAADSINRFTKGLERLTVNKVHNQMVKAEMCPLTHTNTKHLWTKRTSNSPPACGLSLNSLSRCHWWRTWHGGRMDHWYEWSHHCQAGTEGWGIVSRSYPALNSTLMMAPAAAWRHRGLESQPQDPTQLWRQRSYASVSFLPDLPVHFPQALFLILQASEVRPSNYQDVWWHTINIESLGMKLITQFATPD